MAAFDVRPAAAEGRQSPGRAGVEPGVAASTAPPRSLYGRAIGVGAGRKPTCGSRRRRTGARFKGALGRAPLAEMSRSPVRGTGPVVRRGAPRRSGPRCSAPALPVPASRVRERSQTQSQGPGDGGGRREQDSTSSRGRALGTPLGRGASSDRSPGAMHRRVDRAAPCHRCGQAVGATPSRAAGAGEGGPARTAGWTQVGNRKVQRQRQDAQAARDSSSASWPAGSAT